MERLDRRFEEGARSDCRDTDWFILRPSVVAILVAEAGFLVLLFACWCCCLSWLGCRNV